MENILRWIKTNRGLGCLLTFFFVLFLIYLLLSSWVHIKLPDGFALGFFPVSGIFLLTLCSILMIFDSHRNETPTSLEEITLKSIMTVILVVTLCLTYFLLISQLGFLITNFVSLSLSIYLLGIKSWRKSIFTAIIVTVAVYFIFSLLDVDFTGNF